MARIHPTAIIESNVQLGEGTSVWDNVHIRRDAVLGDECIVGGKSMIAYEVQIGHRVKINSNVYICNGVTIEDGVMISAGTIFTNDRFPRATIPDFCLAIGTPARVVGVVCKCGEPVHRFGEHDSTTAVQVTCQCGLSYSINGHAVVEAEAAIAV